MEKLLLELEKRGYQSRVVSIDHLDELKSEIENRVAEGLLDAGLYQDYLNEFDSFPPKDLPAAKSIVIVAIPSPQIRITVDRNGEQMPFIIPPTYPEVEMDGYIRALLKQIQEPGREHFSVGYPPKKLLAVRSGLASYGKNNVAYVPGMGSFFGLAGIYTDYPTANSSWQEPKMMERCENCSACLHRCPSGAITAERFLLHAERCITYHNEKPAGIPFPDWIDPAWHNCIIGCLHCQWVCPENKDVKSWVKEGPVFTREETELFLAGTPLEQVPAATRAKMHSVNLERWLSKLPRNLGALLSI